MPFDSDEFLACWDLWKEYKKDEYRFGYKSVISEQAALNKLTRLSDGKEDQAMKIVMQSIESGWRGLFALKKEYFGVFGSHKSDQEERVTQTLGVIFNKK